MKFNLLFVVVVVVVAAAAAVVVVVVVKDKWPELCIISLISILRVWGNLTAMCCWNVNGTCFQSGDIFRLDTVTNSRI